MLEWQNEETLLEINLLVISAKGIDRGIIIHETILQHRDSTYGSMAKDLLKRVCLCRGEEIHLVLDKYQSPSIKDLERNLRCSTLREFFITGPEQAQRQRGKELLQSPSSKEQFAWFIMEEWTIISGYWPDFFCMFLMAESVKNRGTTTSTFKQICRVTSKAIIIEADTLIAFNTSRISSCLGPVIQTSSSFSWILSKFGRSNHKYHKYGLWVWQ